MKIAIIGANGMVGKKLASQLVKQAQINNQPIQAIQLLDIIKPELTDYTTNSINLDAKTFNLASKDDVNQLVKTKPDVIIHLAAIVSSDAEQNFDKGYSVNLDGTRSLFEAIRQEHIDNGYKPRVVYASSCAVFGTPFPETIPDEFNLKPLTSYGTQKAIIELLLADYSRLGIFEGIGIRLPTISVRPGKPNKAASGFFSGIVREPLNGIEAILPVETSLRHWHASPRSAVSFFIHGASLDYAKLQQEHTYNFTMPGVNVSVEEQISALTDIAGNNIVKLIKHQPDTDIINIVKNWAAGFEAKKARALGFNAENNFKDIIQIYIDDELGGSI